MNSEPNSYTYAVHLGFWTNWSYGAIRGGTITLTRQHGGFLIAFLAIYIGMVGKSFWRLGCFTLHRYLSSGELQDGLHHQRWAWRLMLSMIAWRRHARRPILRLLPIILLAFLVSAAFGIASIFSSHVTTDTANEVLLNGERCGLLSRIKPNNVTAVYSIFKPYHAELTSQFLNYGMQCYGNSSNTDGCNLYTKTHLPLIANPKAACPFNETICKSNENNLILDTGYLHSLKHLGINSSPKDQFQVRVVHECAPLVTDGFTEIFNDTAIGPVMRYLYGKGKDSTYVDRRWTHQAPLNYPYDSNGTGYLQTSRPEYSLGSVGAFGGAAELVTHMQLWSPIPQLQRPDADVSLLFLSAPGIRFSAPVDDPWFNAHQNAGLLYDQDNKTRPSWVQDSAGGVMGCTMQMQYCNPSLSKLSESLRCEPLRGIMDPISASTIPKIFSSKSQLDLVARANDIFKMDTCTIDIFVGAIGAAALRARYGLGRGYQGPLPINQWQLEAEHWVKGFLTSIQDAFVRSANGPPRELDPFLVPPEKNDTAANTMCRNQKIVSTKYSSFNVLGISLILLLGGLIIVLDLTLEPLIACFLKRRYRNHVDQNQAWSAKKNRKHHLYAVLEWSSTNTLQLQRLAYEEAGFGRWEKCVGDNPITLPGEKLGVLNLDDVQHPVFKKQGRGGVKRTGTGLETLVEDSVGVDRKKMEANLEELDIAVTVTESPSSSIAGKEFRDGEKGAR
ncbi:hypothetical protein K469DRAFT_739283 [Zopfia rhizophila CBS 207.26]|uniref:Uncharacterized protein n=1 Tax=Zopfia rhizophila CBS 207.26 TaxID=1314779 RepID=A0A6A6E3D8_9PEZI|nr:hypothetical protein K469DRAFT_739283 [Zopfia rhizophila CBS 207.26]